MWEVLLEVLEQPVECVDSKKTAWSKLKSNGEKQLKGCNFNLFFAEISCWIVFTGRDMPHSAKGILPPPILPTLGDVTFSPTFSCHQSSRRTRWGRPGRTLLPWPWWPRGRRSGPGCPRRPRWTRGRPAYGRENGFLDCFLGKGRNDVQWQYNLMWLTEKKVRTFSSYWLCTWLIWRPVVFERAFSFHSS